MSHKYIVSKIKQKKPPNPPPPPPHDSGDQNNFLYILLRKLLGERKKDEMGVERESTKVRQNNEKHKDINKDIAYQDSVCTY